MKFKGEFYRMSVHQADKWGHLGDISRLKTSSGSRVSETMTLVYLSNSWLLGASTILPVSAITLVVWPPSDGDPNLIHPVPLQMIEC